MKRTIYILLTAALVAACVNDLDTLPLNKTEPVSEYVYGTNETAYKEGLGRLYFQFVTNDLTDLQQMDGGASEVIRAFWSVQETSTDEAKCSWENDAWVRALNTNTWSEVQNDAVYAVYVRTLQGIALVNEYLRQTTPEKLQSRGVSAELARKIDGFRDEARFIRAYLYW
ncbi:MAG: RagB/SusD family nutrient uptake outer membrane protein, partial [Bacteroidales bacterium]|nr:RagB/SusD family nutrient uptake outer membrane protein [Bacteroidales bacterium]